MYIWFKETVSMESEIGISAPPSHSKHDPQPTESTLRPTLWTSGDLGSTAPVVTVVTP